jgi:hypothetical protein
MLMLNAGDAFMLENECDMISCYVSYVVHYELGSYDDEFVPDRTFYLDAMATEAYSPFGNGEGSK